LEADKNEDNDKKEVQEEVDISEVEESEAEESQDEESQDENKLLTPEMGTLT
jgi:hypothetical protein